ncbi:uncharacterized protein MONBRDRAFT_5584 [Monosiga brevicollis MX1]|uniref:Uncharacterized protein n=1 Tax=Monosiga brevicollis TaxID=81824 RepID=A9URV8_MONBE|nr:uncharacterized protein MONBRDRAFT_5584 [Monosiga brevicollis MX1]EDQ91994.1 predicted protein [Monosiga brevicollis MX1]|eukprot:XP_001743280.1 hypothetical protein [Monosiga brevicollis MX1]
MVAHALVELLTAEYLDSLLEKVVHELARRLVRLARWRASPQSLSTMVLLLGDAVSMWRWGHRMASAWCSLALVRGAGTTTQQAWGRWRSIWAVLLVCSRRILRQCLVWLQQGMDGHRLLDRRQDTSALGDDRVSTARGPSGQQHALPVEAWLEYLVGGWQLLDVGLSLSSAARVSTATSVLDLLTGLTTRRILRAAPMAVSSSLPAPSESHLPLARRLLRATPRVLASAWRLLPMAGSILILFGEEPVRESTLTQAANALQPANSDYAAQAIPPGAAAQGREHEPTAASCGLCAQPPRDPALLPESGRVCCCACLRQALAQTGMDPFVQRPAQAADLILLYAKSALDLEPA